MGIVVLHLDVS